MVFIPQAQPHAQSLFLFPIVFGINNIMDVSSKFSDFGGLSFAENVENFVFGLENWRDGAKGYKLCGFATARDVQDTSRLHEFWFLELPPRMCKFSFSAYAMQTLSDEVML